MKNRLNEYYIESDLSDVEEVMALNYKEPSSFNGVWLYDVNSFVKSLNNTGLDKFKIRSSRLHVSEAQLDDAWMDLKERGWSWSTVFDSSVRGFNEFYLFVKNGVSESMSKNKPIKESSMTTDELRNDVFNALADIAFFFDRNGVKLTEKDWQDAVHYFMSNFFENSGVNESLSVLKESSYIKRFSKDDSEYKKLEKLANILNELSPNGYRYYVANTYFDFGQGLEWTTILCDKVTSTYQALSPVEQKKALLSISDDGLKDIAIDVLTDSYCPDKGFENTIGEDYKVHDDDIGSYFSCMY